MARLSKNQQRQQKVAAKRRKRLNDERRKQIIQSNRTRKANIKIMAAMEMAVARASANYNLPDLAARYLLIDVLENHLFMADDESHVAENKTIVSHQDNNGATVLENKSVAGVFDKSAWGGR